MSIDVNDPRLTTYALGEMDEDEKAAFEAELEGSPEAKAELEEITRFAKELEDELANGAPIALGDEHRALIAKKALEGEIATEKEKARAPADGAKVIAFPEKKRPAYIWALSGALALAATAAGIWFAVSVVAPNNKTESAAATGSAGAKVARAEKGDGREGENGPPHAAASARAFATSAQTASPAASAQSTEQKGDVPPVGLIQGGGAVAENPFVDTTKDTKSTFSIDVDTASYSMIRRSLKGGSMPPGSIVRLEEMINYFHYAYPSPDDAAFSVTTDVTAAPWDAKHRLVRIGLQGRKVEAKQRPAANLVFLLDVSGSMDSPDKLPLLIEGMQMLTGSLNENDHVSIVVYAGASGLVLPSTSGAQKGVISAALANLKAGGSTNGGAGIQLAYEEAKSHFIPGGVNRVILATDGDFNVGVTNQGDLVKLIQEKAKDNIFLSVLGFGTGNFKDSTLEMLADKGNGNYAYLDSVAEAKKVLVEQGAGTLQTIAKDVKIQVTFDSGAVGSFKLLGYENRVLAHTDFNDDKKDAGEIGAGHTVTALYEIVLKDGAAKAGLHVADVAVRYKEPEAETSRLVETKISDAGGSFDSAPEDARFAASVAGFGLLLRGSKTAGDLGYADVARLARAALGDDQGGYRKELVELVELADRLKKN